MINNNNNTGRYDGFPSTRPQSPFSTQRGAYPGAVLLSPLSSTMGNTPNNISNNSANIANSSSNGMLSPLSGSHRSYNMPFSDILDRQPFGLDASNNSSLLNINTNGLNNHINTNNNSKSNSINSISANNNKSSILNNNIQQPIPINSSKLSSQYQSVAAGSATLSTSLQSPKQHQLSTSTSSSHLDSFMRSSSAQPLMNTSDSNNMVNFTKDINQLCSWVSLLSSSQQNTVMDNLLSSLNDDVLQYTKLKLDSLMNSGYLSPQPGSTIASPIPNKDSSTLNLDSVFSKVTNNLNSDMVQQPQKVPPIIYQPWSPQPVSPSQSTFDYSNGTHERPKSADPHLIGKSRTQITHNNNFHNSNNNNYMKSKSSKRMAADHNNHLNVMSHNHSPKNRQQLDFGYHNNVNSTQSRTTGHQQDVNMQSPGATTSHANNANNNNSNSSMSAKSLTDPKLLTNIPAWLKTLRLHKYSSVLEDTTWEQLIYLDDSMLEEKGVSALGARRKLLKALSIVKECKDQDLIDKSAYL